MGERENHDLVERDLIGNRERKPIEHGHTSIFPVTPLWRRFGESQDQRKGGLDLVLQLRPETGLPRFVVVDLVINLGDGEPMEAQIPSTRACGPTLVRTCSRYSSIVIVSAMPASTSAPRRAISASQASAVPSSVSVSRLRISFRAPRRARSLAGRRRISGEHGAPDITSVYLCIANSNIRGKGTLVTDSVEGKKRREGERCC